MTSFGYHAPAARSKKRREAHRGMGGTAPEPPQNRRTLILLGFWQPPQTAARTAAANHRTRNFNDLADPVQNRRNRHITAHRWPL
jgi:hypothetical protein